MKQCVHWKAGKCRRETPVICDMVVVDDNPRFKIVGMINNCEFVFFTDNFKTEWHFEVSLNPMVSVDTLQRGDPAYFHMSHKHEEEEPMTTAMCQRIVMELARRLPTLMKELRSGE